MKKMLLATALALLITGCSTDVYCSNKPAAVAPKGNHHPSFLRFWNWAEETVDAAKICAAQKKLQLKTETQQTFANILLWFYYFRHLYPLEARVLLITRMSFRPSIWATYLHCSLIYFWVPSSCFCIVISLSLRVK